jgi:ubiquinone/menaquinone biosynthesis C-methylase UbiE
MSIVRDWYQLSYATLGLSAQRRYPNEAFVRFLGERFFAVDFAQRSKIKMLELGCGSGANLWMVAREGFDAYGIDLSDEAIRLCRLVLDSWGVTAALTTGSMSDLPYSSGMFDAVADVFSANCLTEAEFASCLDEVTRVTKPGGYFFSFSPSKNSDAFKNFRPATKIDASTLDGIARPTSPFYGNSYHFRFISQDDYATALSERGFAITSNERIGRTYWNGTEYFECVSISARKL